METFKDEALLEPLVLYKDRLKDAFHNNAIDQFDQMTKRANTNVDANQKFWKIYYDEMKIIAKLKKSKGLRIFFLVMDFIIGIGSFIAAVLLILNAGKGSVSEGLGIGLGIGLIVLGIICIFLSIILIKKIVELHSEIKKREEKAEKAKNDAWNELTSLFKLYDYNMAAVLMRNTTPLIQLDPVFDGEKYTFLNEKYGYQEETSTKISTTYVQSGSILGNPFVFKKNYVQTMRDHRYSGSITITWTERVSDGNGGTKTVTRSQVLTAYYTAPEPAYYLDTWLIYGNEAAPKLSFSRYPTDINNMNDNQISKYVDKFIKKLDKKVEKEILDGDAKTNFTRLPNTEFEALFNALDRDNEVEFRILFTALAQENMIKLLRGKDVGFGDDFIFKKRKKLNYIKSGHMQGSDSLDKDPNSLMHFDHKVAKDLFVKYCDKYLKDVFFDLAPLLSIPIYQQNKTIEYIYENKFKHNITQAEAESAANAHDINYFKHPKTRSAGVILKSDFARTEGESDVYNVTAHSFEGIDRVEIVPTMGGDGKMHNVPVKWIEYKPINRVTPLVVMDTKKDKGEFDSSFSAGQFKDLLSKFVSSDIIYKKRIFSFLAKDNK